MRDAVKRLKEIVSTKDILPLLMHFIFRNGYLYASNGNMTACVPISGHDDLERFAVLATEFTQFLDRSEGELKIKLTDNGVIRVSAGKMRAEFRSLAIEEGFDGEADESGEDIQLGDEFTARLSAVRPFVSDNATKPFATCILLRGADLYSTSNVALSSAKSGISVARDFLLPYRVADYLIKWSEGLSRMVIHDNRSVHFFWDDGSWMGANGLDVPYPDIAPVIATIGEPSWELTGEWRASLREVIRLGDQKVDVFSDKFVSRTEKSTVYEIDAPTLLPSGMIAFQFEPKYIGQVFDTATHIELKINGGKVHVNFANSVVRGVGLTLKL